MMQYSTAHAKEALELSKVQEVTQQMSHQEEIAVSSLELSLFRVTLLGRSFIPLLPFFLSLFLPLPPSLPLSPQKHQAYVKQFQVEKVKTEHEERRKTMGAEVKQHQERAKFEDQLARRRYDDQLSQQVYTHSLSLLPSLSLFLSFSFLTHSHTHTLTHTHTLSLSLSLSHTHTYYVRSFLHF